MSEKREQLTSVGTGAQTAARTAGPWDTSAQWKAVHASLDQKYGAARCEHCGGLGRVSFSHDGHIFMCAPCNGSGRAGYRAALAKAGAL